MNRTAHVCLLLAGLCVLAGCSMGVWQGDESRRYVAPGDDAARVARSRAHLYSVSIDELSTFRDAANAQRLDLLAQADAYRKRAASALSDPTYSEGDRQAHARLYAEFAARIEREAEVCAERAQGYTDRMALLENKRQQRLLNAERYDSMRTALP